MTDLMSVRRESEWMEVLKSVYGDTGLVASLSDAEGAILLTSGERNPLCAAVRANPESLKFICAATASAMTGMLKQTKRPVVEICEAGLLRFVVPVLAGGDVIGQISGCGKRTEDEDVDSFYLSKQIGISEDEVNTRAKELVFVSEEDVSDYAEALHRRLNG